MDFSKLSSSDRVGAVAAAVVVVLAIVSLVNAWGALMLLPLLAGVAFLAVLLMPQLSPNTSPPGSKGSLLVIAGGVGAVFWLIVAISWLGWIFDNLGSFDALQFLIGFIASLVMAWTGWQAFQAEGARFQLRRPASAAAPLAPAAPPAAPLAPPSAEPGAPAPPPSMGEDEDRTPP